MIEACGDIRPTSRRRVCRDREARWGGIRSGREVIITRLCRKNRVNPEKPEDRVHGIAGTMCRRFV